MSLLGGSEPEFDPIDAFVPKNLPEPGAFLREGEVLTGDRHVAVHRRVTDAFEEHGVYDVTFGYNLARLSLDPRHPDAGFRYGEPTDPSAGDDGDDSHAGGAGGENASRDVLRVEFVPTTAFCPQAEPLAVGALRALRSTPDIGYDALELRVAERAHEAERINERLASDPLDGEGVEGDGGDGVAGRDGRGEARDGTRTGPDSTDGAPSGAPW